MRILILCNNATGLNSFRGLLVKTLIDKGNIVLAVVPTTDDKNELTSESELNKIGCRLIHMGIDRRGINPLHDSKLFFSYLALLNKEKPELVLTYTIKPGIYGGIACRIRRIPYAVNITGLGTAFESNGIVKKLVCILYKVALKNEKVVFFENIENRDIFVKLHLAKEEKTKVLAGAGVDLEKFSYLEYPENNGETRFLFSGRVMKEKGIDELIEAIRRLRNEGIKCTLDIIGWLEEDFAETIKICEKEGWLRFHGPQNDVRPFIANCHCFVLPSWHEGMANTNLECAASGRPVITSNIHGCMEAVENGKTGYLCERQNVESLYEIMKQFCGCTKNIREEMGLAGRKRMEELFDKRNVVKETIAYMMGDKQ